MTVSSSTSVSDLLTPAVALPARPSTDRGRTAKTLYGKCMALARNLSWTWSPEAITLFQDIDPVRWRALDHNPIALLSEFTPEELHTRAVELVLQSRINQAYRRLKEYLSQTPLWAKVASRAARSPILAKPPIVR